MVAASLKHKAAEGEIQSRPMQNNKKNEDIARCAFEQQGTAAKHSFSLRAPPAPRGRAIGIYAKEKRVSALWAATKRKVRR